MYCEPLLLLLLYWMHHCYFLFVSLSLSRRILSMNRLGRYKQELNLVHLSRSQFLQLQPLVLLSDWYVVITLSRLGTVSILLLLTRARRRRVIAISSCVCVCEFMPNLCNCNILKLLEHFLQQRTWSNGWDSRDLSK